MEKVSCLNCHRAVDNVREHFKNGECTLGRPQLIGKWKMVFSNKTVGCYQCGILFLEHRKYDLHSKNCKRSSSINPLSSRDSSTPFDTLKKVQIIEDEGYRSVIHPARANPTERLSEWCKQYLIASEQPYRSMWVEKHRGFNEIILFQFYQKYVDKFTHEIANIIPEIKISELKSIRKFDWSQVIRESQDIFNKTRIEALIASYDENLQRRIKKSLNLVYEKYPIVEKFQIKKTSHVSLTEKDILMPAEFLEVVTFLMSTKSKRMIHFAADLMIMYQSGLRFPSSIEGLTPKIVQLLKQGANDDSKRYFTIQSSKTGSSQRVVFDIQLLQILRVINWTSFAFEDDFYGRLSSFLPFKFLSMRRGYFCFLFFRNGQQSTKAIQLLSQHKSERNISIYIDRLLVNKLIQHKTQLRIPNLIFQGPEKKYPSCKQLSKLSGIIKLPQGWSQKAYKFLIKQTYPNQTEINLQKQSTTFIPPINILSRQSTNSLEIASQVLQKQDPQSEQEQEENLVEKVLINQTEYEIVGNLFNFKDLFTESEGNCCQLNVITFICAFCEKKYCYKCRKQFYCTKCCLVSQTDGKRFSSSSQRSSLQLSMPKDYIFECVPSLLQQFMFLVFARGYHFSNVAVDHPTLKLPKLSQFAAKIELQYFNQYINLKYFPPIEPKTFGISKKQENGTGFGVFATAHIDKHIFIGQYATDLQNNSEIKFCTRQDMSFTLYRNEDRSQNLILGPIKFCGYVPIINDLGKRNNCQSATATVEGRLRIVVFTSKKILPGEQLGYSYLRRKSVSENDNHEESSLLISGKDNNCYVSVILQFFYRYPQIFCPNSSNHKLLKLLSEFFQKQYHAYQTKSLQHALETFGFQFKRQHDCAELFLKLIEQSEYFPGLRNIKIIEKIQTICTLCQGNSQSIDQINHISVGNDEQPDDFTKQRFCLLEDYMCSVCQRSCTSRQIRSITQTNHLLIFHFKRATNQSWKIVQTKTISDLLTFEEKDFQFRYCIVHQGESIENGHFSFADIHRSILIDNEKEVFLDSQMIKDNIYMAIYERKERSSKETK